MRDRVFRLRPAIACLIVTALSGCKPNSSSSLRDSAPGGQANDISGNGSPQGAEAGPSIGGANAQLNSDEYFKPNGTPFSWTDSMTQSVLAGLAKSCPGGAAADGMVAFSLDGQCQMFRIDDARQHISDLGAMFAKHGTSLVDVMSSEAVSEDLKTAEAASPVIDLGSVVNAQNANNGSGQGGSSALALDDPPSGDGWTGVAKNYTVGSNQFSATASGYFYVLDKNGVGLRISADVTGKAFSIQRSLVYAKLQAQALTVGKQAEVDLQVQVFGQDAYNKSYKEPQLTGNPTLLSLDHNFPGTINFAIGPVPFSVTWSFHVTGSVPASYTVRPTSATGGINPQATTTVGLEGGADIKVAKAGVGGQFTIVSASLNGTATAALSTNDSGIPAVCYSASLDFSLNNLLGGSLNAYAQIGRPDVKIMRIPMGWRGDFTFVKWDGTNYDLPIVTENQRCLAVPT